MKKAFILSSISVFIFFGCLLKDDKEKQAATNLIDPRDNQDYNIVVIDSQTWMAENLNYAPVSGNSWCYSNSDSLCSVYGRIYDWATAMNLDLLHNNEAWGGSDIAHQGLCPDGWHIPSDAEWKTLEMAIGMSQADADQEGFRGAGEGKKLKSVNWGGTDDFGFAALPAGTYVSDYLGGFYGLEADTYFCSATEYGVADGQLAWYRALRANDNVFRGSDSKAYGYSIRCVKNTQ